MNETSWWIITTAVAALGATSWWFFRRYVNQSDEREKLSNERIIKTEEKMLAQKDEHDQRMARIEAGIMAMKDSIIATVYDSSRHVNENIANLRVEMARDYLPRAEHRQDIQRLEDRLMEGT